MLLRRITEHVKAQNWTAVALDLVIVVVGVLMAFQITAWNDARIADAEQLVLTERLKSDLARHRQTMSWTAEYYEAVRRYGQQAETLLEGQAAEGDGNALLVAAFRATQTPGYPPSRAAYDELVATGSLSAIKNENVHRIATLLFEPGYYLDSFTDVGSFPYRARFRQLLPSEVHSALHAQCGDRYDLRENIGMPRIEIDYECVVNFTESELLRAAASIREDKRLLELLRYRLADLETNMINMQEAVLTYDEHVPE